MQFPNVEKSAPNVLKCSKFWRAFQGFTSIEAKNLTHFGKSAEAFQLSFLLPHYMSRTVHACAMREKERKGEKKRKQPWIGRERRDFQSIKVLFTEQFKKKQGNAEETRVQQAIKSSDDNVRVLWTSKQRNNAEHRVHKCLFGGGTRREDDKV